MNPDSDLPDPSAPGPEPAAPRGTRETLDDLSRTLTEAILKGGRDARRSFEEGAPKVKSEFARGLHEVAYAVGFAATFGTALLREVAPDPLRDGLREGAASGRRAAEEVVRRQREKAEREAKAAPDVDTEGAWV